LSPHDRTSAMKQNSSTEAVYALVFAACVLLALFLLTA
jgi:hypothetical protein